MKVRIPHCELKKQYIAYYDPNIPYEYPSDSLSYEMKCNEEKGNESTGDKTPPQSKREIQNGIRKSLEDYFIEITKLPPPKIKTKAQQKSAGTLWWNPLRDIAELTGWDIIMGNALIDKAVRRLRSDDLTISSPKSIINTVRAIWSEAEYQPLGQVLKGVDGQEITI